MAYQNYDPTADTEYTGYTEAPYVPPDIPAWSDSEGSENPTSSTRYRPLRPETSAATCQRYEDDSADDLIGDFVRAFDEDDSADDLESLGSDLIYSNFMGAFNEENQYTFPARGKQDKHPLFRRDYNPRREDKLCHICRQIDFEYLLQRHAGWPRSIVLGTAAELGARAQDCVLCTFVVKAWLIHPSVSNALDNYNIALAPFKGKDTTVKAVLVRSPNDTIELIEFQDGASPGLRQVQRRYDPELLRDWLRHCGAAENRPRRKEVADKAASASATDKASIKRFIDVQRECVVDASLLPGPPKYAALSYVWGSEPQKVLLTVASTARLYTPGFLSAVTGLSKTIRDAITVCKDLDIPLLWVDALCIRQDGLPEEDQLGIMHLIYEEAAFTIVALAGESADHGLEGVSDDGPADRRVKVRVRGLELLKKQSRLEFSLAGAYWSSRAWTYQEFLLSPRRIVFDQNIIYYSCHHGTFREDMHDNGKHKGDSRWDMRPYSVDWSSVGWDTYRHVVTEYTRKNLSYDRDYLIAFNAVLQALKRAKFTDKFIFGLPVSHFDKALLWRRFGSSDKDKDQEQADTSRPRRGSVILPPEKGREGGLADPPSWSWASFQGRVRYDWRYDWKSFIPPDPIRRVKFLTKGSSRDLATMGGVLELEADVANFKLALPGPEDSGGVGYGEDDDGEDDEVYKDDEDDDDEDDDDEDVDDEDDDDKDDDDEDGDDEDDDDEDDDEEDGEESVDPRGRSYLKIIEYKRKTESYHCGIVLEDDISGDPPTEASFIKMSQSSLDMLGREPTEAELFEGPGKNRLGHLSRDVGSNDESILKDHTFLGHTIFDSDTYNWGRWPVYNVLMVAWRDNGVAVRLGVGRIHVDAFDDAKSFKRKRFQFA
ncbi:hypothetical protein DL767_004687 [Monosporascus sp. MG133]|nr:hypothetical protein DL767_004687 [Monosporascus sp. MG133]